MAEVITDLNQGKRGDQVLVFLSSFCREMKLMHVSEIKWKVHEEMCQANQLLSTW